MTYDSWKCTNPDDEFLGPEPVELHEFYIIIDRGPGSFHDRWYCVIQCENECDAWDYALDRADNFGPNAWVHSVKKMEPYHAG